ncbi:hypothetical protein E2C01_061731 [Portunus trituberculatus]|uniref:Uncharacterized protein n=1 Tax=Portunus trituberculatus TaxID=210409 RepID=A0A5B7HG33_PORTR|nr:hypothetical protein [Portunus trituberculatus]
MTSSSEALKNVSSGHDGSWKIQSSRGRFNGIRACLIVSRGGHAFGQHSLPPPCNASAFKYLTHRYRSCGLITVQAGRAASWEMFIPVENTLNSSIPDETRRRAREVVMAGRRSSTAPPH